ncbi:hypothetical protein SmJEL517_g00846 [Synchytrium microbalum]|uniref:RRM domain-containing protein n=1 Tax=Synchytrium microbalum TaxID=1806994 RepID=A0A507CGA6_9FUNG|nr:uncharacterized protein SmJEL517_g00846 [Synchytrium microbalum]TPX37046.1 hypothetical protein SmJEL517_g00846 [Synchytrium microbalum]
MDEIEQLLEAPYIKEEKPRREVPKEGSERTISNGDDTHMDVDAAPTDEPPSDRKSKENGDHEGSGSHRSRSGERRRRHRSRSRSKGRSRRSSRSTSRHRRGSRSPRRRSRDRRDRDKGDRGDRGDRERDGGGRDRGDRDRERDRDRASRRDRERGDHYQPHYRRPPSPARRDSRDRRRSTSRDRRRSKSQEVSESDRDRRTIFARQLAARLKERELKDFLSAAGKVRDVKIIVDRISGRSKGIGYVEFYDEESVAKAIEMNGQKLLGLPILIELTESEKNRLAEQAAGKEPSFNRLYIGSLHFNITEEDLRAVFEPFGPLDLVQMHKDADTGRSRGFAFVQYRKSEDANQALQKMNGFELAGRPLKVNLVTQDKQALGLATGSVGGTNAANNGLNAFANLDDHDGPGFALNSHARAELMAKLARDDTILGSPAPVAAPVIPKITVPVIATRCVLLKNMFDPNEESEPNWDKEIEEDVKAECSKFGTISHISLQKETAGHIYIKFSLPSETQACLSTMNGRYFGGKQISATFVPDQIYNAQFKLS